MWVGGKCIQPFVAPEAHNLSFVTVLFGTKDYNSENKKKSRGEELERSEVIRPL